LFMGSFPPSSFKSQPVQFGGPRFPSTKLGKGQITRYKKQLGISDSYDIPPDRTVKSDEPKHWAKKTLPKWAATAGVETLAHSIPMAIRQAKRSGELSKRIETSSEKISALKTKTFSNSREGTDEAKAYVQSENALSRKGHYRVSALRHGGDTVKTITLHTNDTQLALRAQDHLNQNPFGDAVGDGYESPASSAASSTNSSPNQSVENLPATLTTKPAPPPPRRSSSKIQDPFADPAATSSSQKPAPPPPRRSKPTDPFADPQ
jgi:hypothetical protein